VIESRDELQLLLAYLPEVRRLGTPYLMRLPTADRIMVTAYLRATGEIDDGSEKKRITTRRG